jgi:hypothetical protein
MPYTQMCRRQKELNMPLGVKYDKDMPVNIAIDSTWINAFSKGVDQAEVGREERMDKASHNVRHIKQYDNKSNNMITSVQITDEHKLTERNSESLLMAQLMWSGR